LVSSATSWRMGRAARWASNGNSLSADQLRSHERWEPAMDAQALHSVRGAVSASEARRVVASSADVAPGKTFANLSVAASRGLGRAPDSATAKLFGCTALEATWVNVAVKEGGGEHQGRTRAKVVSMNIHGLHFARRLFCMDRDVCCSARCRWRRIEVERDRVQLQTTRAQSSPRWSCCSVKGAWMAATSATAGLVQQPPLSLEHGARPPNLLDPACHSMGSKQASQLLRMAILKLVIKSSMAACLPHRSLCPRSTAVDHGLSPGPCPKQQSCSATDLAGGAYPFHDWRRPSASSAFDCKARSWCRPC
jgi:hypothetical protein